MNGFVLQMFTWTLSEIADLESVMSSGLEFYTDSFSR